LFFIIFPTPLGVLSGASLIPLLFDMLAKRILLYRKADWQFTTAKGSHHTGRVELNPPVKLPTTHHFAKRITVLGYQEEQGKQFI